MIIQRKGGKGRVSVWADHGEIYIRESLDRGKDVQTVALSLEELQKIVVIAPKELQEDEDQHRKTNETATKQV